MSTNTVNNETGTTTSTEPELCMVKVRFAGQRKFWFVGPNGAVTDLRIRASLIDGADRATEVANDLLAQAEDVAAVAVMQGRKRVFHAGQPTPPRPVYGPEAGYRYLVDVRAGCPVFHVKNPDGQWAPFTEDAYEVCVAEADRAGAAGRLVVHGSLNLLVTDGMRFVQHTNTGTGMANRDG